MPTVLDIIKRKRITDFVWRDVRKIDGTALHVWKKRSKRVLPKKNQILNGQEIPLIDFPDYFASTISSIIAYHFVRKEKRRRKQMYQENSSINKQPSTLLEPKIDNRQSGADDQLDNGQLKRKKRKRIVVKKKLNNNSNYTDNYYKTNTIRHTAP